MEMMKIYVFCNSIELKIIYTVLSISINYNLLLNYYFKETDETVLLRKDSFMISIFIAMLYDCKLAYQYANFKCNWLDTALDKIHIWYYLWQRRG